MSDLTKKLHTTEGLVSFTFSRIFTVRGVIYFVSVSGNDIQHYFHMEARSGSWKIVKAPKPPDWLLQYEDELAKVILENQV